MILSFTLISCGRANGIQAQDLRLKDSHSFIFYLLYNNFTFQFLPMQEDSLSVWNRTATDMTSTTRIRDTLRRILNIPLTTAMEYKIHCDSLKYVSM